MRTMDPMIAVTGTIHVRPVRDSRPYPANREIIMAIPGQRPADPHPPTQAGRFSGEEVSIGFI